MSNLAVEKARLMEELESLRRAEGNETSQELQLLKRQVPCSLPLSLATLTIELP